MTLPTIFDCLKYSTYEVPNPYGVSWSSYKKMRSLRTLPTIFNCFKYSTYVVVKPDGVSWSAYANSFALLANNAIKIINPQYAIIIKSHL